MLLIEPSLWSDPIIGVPYMKQEILPSDLQMRKLRHTGYTTGKWWGPRIRTQASGHSPPAELSTSLFIILSICLIPWKEFRCRAGLSFLSFQHLLVFLCNQESKPQVQNPLFWCHCFCSSGYLLSLVNDTELFTTEKYVIERKNLHQ